jgi:4-hydroxybenzoyl-CoA thioesterase
LVSQFESIAGRFACEVYWGDCDPAGIIFYPTYFRWMDAATWAFMGSVGFSPQRMREEHLSMPLVGADCKFLQPARHGDRCEVRSRIARFGGASFVVSHEVVRDDGTVLATGSETRVWARYVDGPGTPIKAQPIPEDVKARFAAT